MTGSPIPAGRLQRRCAGRGLVGECRGRENPDRRRAGFLPATAAVTQKGPAPLFWAGPSFFRGEALSAQKIFIDARGAALRPSKFRPARSSPCDPSKISAMPLSPRRASRGPSRVRPASSAPSSHRSAPAFEIGLRREPQRLFGGQFGIQLFGHISGESREQRDDPQLSQRIRLDLAGF
jgi:hypothetical protein